MCWRGAGERWATRVVVSVEAAAVQGDPRGRAGGQEEPAVEVSVYLRPARGSEELTLAAPAPEKDKGGRRGGVRGE